MGYPDPSTICVDSDFCGRTRVYHEDMKFASTVLLLALPLLAAAPELSQVKSVYVLPMTSSLDQYLINRLVAKGQYVIVTDPQKADAIFTDRVGEAFDNKLEDILTSKAEKKKKEEEASKDPMGGNVVRLTSFSKGRGTVFLIDRQSRNVLWSTYAKPKTMSADDLNRVADTIVDRLAKAQKGK